ncbi:unnamed protein product, partial [marine sediment metagenome]
MKAWRMMGIVVSVCWVGAAAMGATAGYSDFSANVIRDGTSGTYTTSATSN